MPGSGQPVRKGLRLSHPLSPAKAGISGTVWHTALSASHVSEAIRRQKESSLERDPSRNAVKRGSDKKTLRPIHLVAIGAQHGDHAVFAGKMRSAHGNEEGPGLVFHQRLDLSGPVGVARHDQAVIDRI